MAEKSAEIKRLYRSRKDKVIAGVCGGIADYFKIDPVWVRLIAVLLIFLDGIGIIMYILAWILMPKNPFQDETRRTRAEEIAERAVKKVNRKIKRVEARHNAYKDIKHHDEEEHQGKGIVMLGIILVLVGAIFLLKEYFSWFRFIYVLPIIIIALGLYFIFRGRTK
jgi:phage shock protein C